MVFRGYRHLSACRSEPHEDVVGCRIGYALVVGSKSRMPAEKFMGSELTNLTTLFDVECSCADHQSINVCKKSRPIRNSPST